MPPWRVRWPCSLQKPWKHWQIIQTHSGASAPLRLIWSLRIAHSRPDSHWGSRRSPSSRMLRYRRRRRSSCRLRSSSNAPPRSASASAIPRSSPMRMLSATTATSAGGQLSARVDSRWVLPLACSSPTSSCGTVASAGARGFNPREHHPHVARRACYSRTCCEHINLESMLIRFWSFFISV